MKVQELRQLIREEIRNTIKEQQLNEDLALVGNIALGVAGGIAGLWALVKGVPAILGGLGDAAYAVSSAREKKAKLVAKTAAAAAREETLQPIIDLFDGDNKLKDLYAKLPLYKAGKNNSERTKQLKDISEYIKKKLIASNVDTTYFADISKKLRDNQGQ